MKKTTTALLWAALAVFLPATSNAQDNHQASGPGPSPHEKCQYILELGGVNPLEAYEACIKAETEALGIACTFYSWGGATVITQTTRTIFGATICPDNGLKRAEDAVARWVANKLACESQGKTWNNGSCQCAAGTKPHGTGCIPQDSYPTRVQVPVCTGGKVLNSTMTGCLCPTGTMDWQGSGQCVPAACHEGTVRNSHGYCVIPNWTPPTPPPNPVPGPAGPQDDLACQTTPGSILCRPAD